MRLICCAGSFLVDRVLAEFGHADWLDMDVQGAEHEVLPRLDRLDNVSHVFVGTHGRVIHADLRSHLRAAGFSLAFDFTTNAVAATPVGHVLFRDGVLGGQRVRPRGASAESPPVPHGAPD